jgi:putative ABC transport system permease protein
MRLANVLHLYRVRLRARLLQECFAVVGIAAGVALLFASQIAGQSLSSSVGQLNGGIIGRATLQLTARDAHGFSEHLLAQVRHIRGVRVAAPLLEANANAIGPAGRESVQLVGADASLAELGGALVRRAALTPVAGLGAVVLPAPVASKLGVTKFGATVTLQIGGTTREAALYAQLRERQIGPLVDSPIAVAPLAYAQELSGLPGRLSRVLVEPARGGQAEVQAALRRLAAGRLDVQPADFDEVLFAKAATATNKSTSLFSVISALVGFLFAFNAMLLTVPQRRRLIADLRRDGYTPAAVIGVLLLDATVLGAIACAIGLLLGDELSIHLFRATPGYLASAFAVGSKRVVGAQSVLVAAGGGMLAACVAVLSPLRDILSRDPLAAVTPRREGGDGANAWLLLGGLACLALTLVILLAAPQDAVAGMVSLIAALLLLLPLPLSLALALVRRVAPAITSAVPHIAVMELRSGRARAVAIAATGAVAVFGSVSIQGAHGDLLRGLENAAQDVNAHTDEWVAPAGAYNVLTTAPFPAQAIQAELERLPGVRAVRVYRGGLLDYGDRRVWVIAPPAQATPLIPPRQLLEGNLALASARLRAGGWVVLSKALAAARGLHIGQAFTLPSPDPTRFRVAALSTNIGWAPGAIVMNADDYARAWGSDDASAFNVLLASGVTQARGHTEIQAALGAHTGLAVQTARARADRQRRLSRQGLDRLTQIATLILTAAILAMAAAMAAMVWQRRPRLAKLKLEGFSPRELWQTIMLESAILLGVGCASGAILGLLGQQLLDRALANTINFPVLHSLGLLGAVVSLALVTGSAVAIVAVPGWLAAKVPASVALQD